MEQDYLIYKLSETIKTTSRIDKELFTQFNVKRGLRNEDHSGVLVGLTKVGDVVGYEKLPEGGLKAIPGKLYYRGIDVEDLASGLAKENRLGFEETAFLLLSGYLPDAEELITFKKILYSAMPLNQKATMNIIDLEGQDIMNILARSVLELYTFDPNPDDISRDNLIRQSIELIAKFPTIIAYAYNILRHSQQGRSLHIRHPNEDMSLAENFLYMMKGPNNYTELDVKILDLTLILHADHGGGNNSTFTVRVTSSSQTDTYSSIAAGIGSLKGPLHGGANIKVVQMFEHLKTAIKDWTNVKEIDAYLKKMLNKEAYNKSGLIYGIGHAVYTISDPRALVLKEMARQMAEEKGLQKEFEFLQLLDERSVKAFMSFKGDDINKQVCTNVDFYSGFVYDAIGLPTEVFTPLFAMARITGWTAHRIEELNFASKRIIRPAYKNVGEKRPFTPLKDR
ncbi:Citrate synthase [Paludibacter propionicigenes WB4]|uniref:Citrate synthase n=1 Tax=Paludibacter propionicigenes (strain DSM 17365 / JCM 13257 / WB4) TaxID=694427 RepID=E4T397_PALPW|nr:citrate synthase [Paludibacter propionicigenes]ADQ79191.1 Citrate synthase [Paludibacter propionicigenes WB4]